MQPLKFLGPGRFGYSTLFFFFFPFFLFFFLSFFLPLVPQSGTVTARFFSLFFFSSIFSIYFVGRLVWNNLLFSVPHAQNVSSFKSVNALGIFQTGATCIRCRTWFRETGQIITVTTFTFKIQPDRLKLIRLYPCGSLGQSVSFVFGARVGHFAATPQSDVVGIWSRDLGVMATLSVRQKMPFFSFSFSCIYNPQITVSPTSSFSASFNGNRVKNHP